MTIVRVRYQIDTFTNNQYTTMGKKSPYSELFQSIFSRIQSECGKARTRITPNMDTFYAVQSYIKLMVIEAIRKIDKKS